MISLFSQLLYFIAEYYHNIKELFFGSTFTIKRIINLFNVLTHVPNKFNYFWFTLTQFCCFALFGMRCSIRVINVLLEIHSIGKFEGFN
jgi:hypothetical protein